MAKHKSGRLFWVEVNLKRFAIGDKDRLLAIVRDITDRKKADELTQRERNLFFSIIENFPCGVAMIDKDQCVIHHNSTLTKMLGYTVEDIPTVHDSYFKFYPDPVYRQKVYDHWSNDFGIKNRDEVSTVTCKNGTSKEIEFKPTFLEDGQVVMAMFDVTHRRQMEKQLKYLATHDFLTGIPNRYSFEDSLKRAVAKAKRGVESALLFIDIDNFKLVNDTQGHTTGDDVLIEVVKILKANLRDSDLLARLGGDEFAVLLEKTNVSEARIVAEKLRSIVDESYLYLLKYSFSLNLSLSIGIVIVDGTLNFEKLLTLADIALYEAKDKGRNRVVLLDTKEDMISKPKEITQLIRLIKNAIKENKFALQLQPVIKVSSGKIMHYEALIRLRDMQEGIISPMTFIPVAERYGLMFQIDLWVVQASLEILKKHPNINVFVNISGTSLGEATLLELIQDMISTSGIDPYRIGFEITETAAVKDLVLAELWIKSLKSLGCRFALDDFGIGFFILLLSPDVTGRLPEDRWHICPRP